MKFPEALYPQLVAAVARNKDKALAHAAALAKEPRYQPGGKGDLAKRVRWDLYWAGTTAELKAAILKGYDTGLCDLHIDTALRKAMRELGLEQFAGK